MQNFRAFPSCVLREMHGNPKFDQFHYVKIALLEKSTYRDHKLISSHGGQVTSACKISGHFCNRLSRKCPETPNLTRFISQNSTKIRTRQIWGIWKLRPAYSLETPNLSQNRWCFVPCELEIWWITLENNRASLPCCFKLCATFHSHRWIQTGVTVRKRLIWVKFDDF